MDKQHGYGNVVTFVNRGVRVNALVLQSRIGNVEDKSVEGGVRQEEHLSLLYLKPEMEQSLMGGADIDRAISKEFGVLAVTEAPDDPKNLRSYALVGLTDEQTIYDPNAVIPVALNPHPELVQYPPAHKVQVPAIRDRAPLGKIPAETSYRETASGFQPRSTDWYEKAVAGTDRVPTKQEWVAAGYPPEAYDEKFPATPSHNQTDEAKAEADKAEWLRKEAEAKAEADKAHVA